MAFAESFLEYPDLFPARVAGETWGAEARELDIVGGPYRFTGLDDAWARLLSGRYGGFATDSGAGGEGVEVRLFRAASTDFSVLDWQGGEYRLDIDPQPTHIRVAGHRFMARLDLEPGLHAAIWTCDDAVEAAEATVENFLRLVVAYRLLDLGGTLLHSAGVVHRHRAYLFTGRSNAGKTTVARISLKDGKQVLSDDLNAVLPHAGGSFRAHRLPFTGDLEEPERQADTTELCALIRLVQAPEHRLRRLSDADALSALIASAPYVNVDPQRAEAVAETLSRLIKAVPCYELGFRRGPGFWALIENESP